jgi:hypothetical protein
VPIPKYVIALYMVAGAALLNVGGANLAASWPAGCCTGGECSEGLICCTPPSGWADCSSAYAGYCSPSCPPTGGGSS